MTVGYQRLLLCMIWGITPPKFDELCSAGDLTQSDCDNAVMLWAATRPNSEPILELIWPERREKRERIEALDQNIKILSTMYKQAKDDEKARELARSIKILDEERQALT